MRYLKKFEWVDVNDINYNISQDDIELCCVDLYDKEFNLESIKYNTTSMTMKRSYHVEGVDCLVALSKTRKAKIDTTIRGNTFKDVVKNTLIKDVVKDVWPEQLIILTIEGNDTSIKISPNNGLTDIGRELVDIVEDSAIKLLNTHDYKSVEVYIGTAHQRWQDPATFDNVGYIEKTRIEFLFKR